MLTTESVRRAMTSTSTVPLTYRLKTAVRNMTLITWSRFSSPVALPPLDGSYPITCLTIKNPHAMAIVRGYKPVENRTREVACQAGLVGRWVAISSSSKADSKGKIRQVLDGKLQSTSVNTLLRLADSQGTVNGAVVGFVYVSAVKTLEEVQASDLDEHVAWATGSHCIMFSTILLLHKPISIKGALGLWHMVPRYWSSKPKERVAQQGRIKACNALRQALSRGQYIVTRFNGRDTRQGPRLRLSIQE